MSCTETPGAVPKGGASIHPDASDETFPLCVTDSVGHKKNHHHHHFRFSIFPYLSMIFTIYV